MATNAERIFDHVIQNYSFTKSSNHKIVFRLNVILILPKS